VYLCAKNSSPLEIMLLKTTMTKICNAVPELNNEDMYMWLLNHSHWLTFVRPWIIVIKFFFFFSFAYTTTQQQVLEDDVTPLDSLFQLTMISDIVNVSNNQHSTNYSQSPAGNASMKIKYRVSLRLSSYWDFLIHFTSVSARWQLYRRSVTD